MTQLQIARIRKRLEQRIRVAQASLLNLQVMRLHPGAAKIFTNVGHSCADCGKVWL